MDIAISEQNQERIRRKVESGMYPSVDAVLANALTLLDQRDDDLKSELADMRQKVRKGAGGVEGRPGGPGRARSSMSFDGRNTKATVVRS